MRFLTIFSSIALLAVAPITALAASWAPQHTVIVVLENRSLNQVIGDHAMPYLNALAQGGALMTQSYFAQLPYGIVPAGMTAPLPARPSQPNYLYLFSGHHQGVTPPWFRSSRSPYLGTATHDQNGSRLPSPMPNTTVGIGNRAIPVSWRPLNTPNIAAAIMRSGKSFASFSESLPYPRYEGEEDPDPHQDRYRRKHNPTINWTDPMSSLAPDERRRFVLPIDANLGFENTRDPLSGRSYRGFAVDAQGSRLGFEQLPTVSLVIPNETHDLHSGGSAEADAWLRTNIQPYADWARTHDSLLIITFDEDGSTDSSHGEPDTTGIDRIPTIFFGPPNRVLPGLYDERIDHLNVLSTILDRYGLLEEFKREFLRAHAGVEAANEHANLRPIRDIFGEGPKLAPLKRPGM